jgi:CBS domain-containing protein
MTWVEQPVSRYMSTDVEMVAPDASLGEIARRLGERRISAVPVVAADGAILGVVSRSDLLHAGHFEATEHPGRLALELPDRRAVEMITRPPHLCSPTTSLRDAARDMREHRIHRLFVVEDGRLVGVISTLDLVTAVRDARPEATIGDLMTAPVLTIHASATLADAIAHLDRAHVTGLVVVDDRWPIGMFTQAEALAARDLPGRTPIDDLHDPSLICMPATTCAYHAAAQAAHLDVRRVVACAQHDAVGIVTGLDFAALVAGEARRLTTPPHAP